MFVRKLFAIAAKSSARIVGVRFWIAWWYAVLVATDLKENAKMRSLVSRVAC